MERFRTFLHQVKNDLTEEPVVLKDSAFVHDLKHQIRHNLVEAIGLSFEGRMIPFSRKRATGLNMVLDYIKSNGREAIKVVDFCKAPGVSVRTLNYAFIEQFGVSPKAYLMAHRLKNVRKDLKKTPPFATKISDVANCCEFWKMASSQKIIAGCLENCPPRILRTVLRKRDNNVLI